MTTWPPLVFSGDADPAVLSRAVTRGSLRRLATGVYTSAVDQDPELVVTAHLWHIASHMLPGAVLVDRSARLIGPHNGVLTVQHTRARPLDLPGVRIAPRPGPGPAAGDTTFLGTSLFLSAPARQMLDNLHRARGTQVRTLTDEEVELWVDDLIRQGGESSLLRLRDTARQLAPSLGRERALARLESVVDCAMGADVPTVARTARLRSRANGQPVDPERLRAFQALATELADTGPDIVTDLPEDAGRRALLPFYEAYFSNFIEGTEFTLDETANIVFDRTAPTDRLEDAHDVQATFDIVNSAPEMTRTPHDADELETILRERHAQVTALRPDKLPGQYKLQANRAGRSQFVDPDLVVGTLRHGFEIMAQVTGPFQRAVYMMFLVSEVHPFADGNGRVARIMMNAELVAAGEVRIIVPNVYSNNYIDALRAATRTGHFAALIKTLSFARRYTAQLDFSSREAAEALLVRTHALRDAREAEDAGLRLVLPSRLQGP